MGADAQFAVTLAVLLFSAASTFFSVRTSLAIAQLELRLSEKQEERCSACRKEFVHTKTCSALAGVCRMLATLGEKQL